LIPFFGDNSLGDTNTSVAFAGSISPLGGVEFFDFGAEGLDRRKTLEIPESGGRN
jgi:hypothetical protein